MVSEYVWKVVAFKKKEIINFDFFFKKKSILMSITLKAECSKNLLPVEPVSNR